MTTHTVSTFFQFALLGISVGAVYALAAQGLVLVYRGSGVLNFAHGAIGVSALYLHWELTAHHGVSYGVAFVAAVAFAAALGVLVHLLLMRRLRTAPALIRVVAALAVLILLQGVAISRYGGTVEVIPTTLPSHIWHITGSVTITSDRVYLFFISLALTALLYGVYRYSMFGIGTSAVTQNERAAASLGWSRDAIATSNWALGSALAAAAAILLAPITALTVTGMSSLLLATLAAALVGNFTSFSLTFLGGIVIGLVQTEVGFYSSSWGSSGIGIGSSVPFFVIVAILVVRGRGIPLRDFFLQRQPSVGTGRVRPLLVAASTAAAILVVYRLDDGWTAAVIGTLSAALILLSMVVLTGYAGQISLAQYAIAGFGAWVAGRLIATEGLPMWAGFVVGVAAAVLLGALFALPAVRTRGINLAIVTLGLGFAIEYMIFGNPTYVGGLEGTVVGPARLFGWDFNSITHPHRYASVCVVVFALCALMVANVRRGRSGRRLLAVRTNERAAAALGVGVFSAKLYAFSVAAGIAALGGILTLFRTGTIVYDNVTNVTSILFVGLAAIGGIGYVLGPIAGATLVTGAIGSYAVDTIFSTGVTRWLQVFSGAFLIGLIVQEPDGIAKAQIEQLEWVGARLRPLTRRLPAVRLLRRNRSTEELATSERARVAPRTLEVTGVTVRYGAVVACDAVSLAVQPGEVVGLIGPNGAGKTTLIDAITGFARIAGGTITLDGDDIGSWSAVRRARAGLSRSFQSLELFEDMTVLDNLRTASDPRDVGAYLSDLVWPSRPPLPAQVRAAIDEFALAGSLDRRVEDLAYGERRLLAMARAVATGPSVLLLDECAAGLSEAETRELGQLVRRLADSWGMGILVIEHDVDFVMSVCDRVVVLDFGCKICDGTPDVVRNDAAVIAAYLGTETEAAMETVA